jgi:DUF4097 and DUF4098 domain-containing protein YvlB
MEKTFATPDQVHVKVENAVGSVTIVATDTECTEVTLEAGTPAAQELVDRTVVECRPSGGRDVVRVKIPSAHGPKFMRRNEVTVRITMPRASDVDVATASADMELTGFMGALSLQTGSGDISAENAETVNAKSASGDVSVGSARGSVRLHSASGDLRVETVEGPLEMTTASGDIEVGSAADRLNVRCTAGEVRVGSARGDATIVGVSGDIHVGSYGSGRMKIRAVSGDVSVGIAPGVNLTVDAESMSGLVRSDIDLAEVPVSSGGGPAVVVTARSVSGDVLVERAVGYPA